MTREQMIEVATRRAMEMHFPYGGGNGIWLWYLLYDSDAIEGLLAPLIRSEFRRLVGTRFKRAFGGNAFLAP